MLGCLQPGVHIINSTDMFCVPYGKAQSCMLLRCSRVLQQHPTDACLLFQHVAPFPEQHGTLKDGFKLLKQYNSWKTAQNAGGCVCC